MNMLDENGLRIAVLDDEENFLRDEQAVLDLIAELAYSRRAYHLVIPEKALNPSFFDLRSGFAGNVLQKFVNYQIRVAVVGDFSRYESRALRQFMMESNKGMQVYFAPSFKDALEKLRS